MTVDDDRRVATTAQPVEDGLTRGVGLVGSALSFVFVLTSGLVAILPAFRFESQFPAALPVFLWAAAAGVGHLANAGREALAPWRAAGGLVGIAPYLALLAVTSVAPDLAVPWWTAVVAAAAAALPFVVASFRGRGHPELVVERQVADHSLRGTFLVGLAAMLMVWSVGGPPIVRTIVAVLLALALVVVGLLPHGLAHATRAWSLRHWLALAWGSCVIWVSVPLAVTTAFFGDSWYLAVTMVAAGLPLILVNRADAQGQRS